jgi:hypothetical protein
VGGAAFAWGDAADNVGAVFGAAFGVEGAFFAGKSLNDQTSVFINENRHDVSTLPIPVVLPAFPQGLKPHRFAGPMYGLKPVPFNLRLPFFGTTKVVPFQSSNA